MIKNIYLIGISAFLNVGCSFGFVASDLPPSKSNLEYWHKSGVAVDNRMRDSEACGGDNATNAIINKQAIKAAQLTTETEPETYNRLYLGWRNCMREKGYYYAEK